MTKQKHRHLNSFGWKHAVAVLAFAGALLGGSFTLQKAYTEKQAKKEKIEQARQKAVKDSLQMQVKEPVHDIVYQVDTLDQKSSALLYHMQGQITRNFVENQNMYRMQLPLFVHEKWHHHNYLLGFRTKYSFKPEEYYRLCLHDEITANIAALLTTRYQYMEAKDKKDFIRRYKKGVFGFYVSAIEDGRIDPYDNTPQARKEEWKLIANGTREMWMDKLYSHYRNTAYKMLMNYISLRGLVQDSKKNYNYICNKMYTVGGVNFWNYMDEDIPINDKRVSLTDEISKVPSLNKGGRAVADNINNQLPLLQDIGLDKQQEAFQHLLIASKMKYLLRTFSKEDIEQNSQLVASYYNRLLFNVYRDDDFKNLVENYTSFSASMVKINTTDAEYENTLSRLYSVQGVDLRTIIPGFSASKVPVKKQNNSELFSNQCQIDEKIYGLYVESAFTSIQEDAFINKENALVGQKAQNTSPSAPLQHRRRSEDLVIRAPNFWEPILLNNSEHVAREISACIAEFDAIPDVEKGCDLNAQKAFRQQKNEKTER